jgi:hypothetical protein
MLVLGLGHKAQQGKGEVAHFLTRRFFAFANTTSPSKIAIMNSTHSSGPRGRKPAPSPASAPGTGKRPQILACPLSSAGLREA